MRSIWSEEKQEWGRKWHEESLRRGKCTGQLRLAAMEGTFGVVRGGEPAKAV